MILIQYIINKPMLMYRPILYLFLSKIINIQMYCIGRLRQDLQIRFVY